MSVEDASVLSDTTTAPPAETSVDLQTKLTQLQAAATQQYSLKNYPAAAEFYSEAAELQDEINGEMSLENADLLYQYGRCLYHVAVAKSDVLGGKVAGTEEPKRKKRKVAGRSGTDGDGEISDALKSGEERLAEEVVGAVVEEKESGAVGVKEEETAASKPYFQITGDENFTDSEEDEDDEAADAEAEEEEDDFATAFEVLDMARILLSRKLAAADKDDEKGVRILKERLADTHDLQAEISLENERFHDAIKDTRDALALKLDLYPQESSLIAEAHFKLSLALEFASVTSSADGEGDSGNSGGGEGKVMQVDEKMRAEAAKEMEKAIASCELRIQKEEEKARALQSIPDGDSNSNATTNSDAAKSIAEVKEVVEEMQQRLVDLRAPAVSRSGPTGPAGAPIADEDAVKGILGELLGESKGEQARRIAEATAGARDLTAVVRSRKKAKKEDGETVADGKGKRKLEEVETETVKEGSGNGGKKVKFENGV